MSRFADALRRAENPAGRGSSAESGTLRLFVPRERAATAPGRAERSDLTLRDHPSSPLLPRGMSVAERLEWFANDGTEKQFAREQYNRLAAALHEAQCARGIKTVLVTSAVPREGKTLTASNLSLTLSESYQRKVLLIDADLRRPMVHTLFGVPGEPGLSESLRGHRPLAITSATSRLSLLPSGDAGSDPMRTLACDGMRHLIEAARAEFDWVVIDTPPVGLLPDASVLVAMADGALLVAMAGRTPHDAIKRAAETLGEDRIFGVVLNGVIEANLPHPYDREYYGAAPRS